MISHDSSLISSCEIYVRRREYFQWDTALVWKFVSFALRLWFFMRSQWSCEMQHRIFGMGHRIGVNLWKLKFFSLMDGVWICTLSCNESLSYSTKYNNSLISSYSKCVRKGTEYFEWGNGLFLVMTNCLYTAVNRVFSMHII